MQFPKPRPALLDRQAKRKQIQAEDEAENRKVKQRSGGRCEVRLRVPQTWGNPRCHQRATEIHHLLGGWRIRGKGESAKAEMKLHCCRECHREITGHVLRRIGGVTPHYADVYERVK